MVFAAYDVEREELLNSNYRHDADGEDRAGNLPRRRETSPRLPLNGHETPEQRQGQHWRQRCQVTRELTWPGRETHESQIEQNIECDDPRSPVRQLKPDSAENKAAQNEENCGYHPPGERGRREVSDERPPRLLPVAPIGTHALSQAGRHSQHAPYEPLAHADERGRTFLGTERVDE